MREAFDACVGPPKGGVAGDVGSMFATPILSRTLPYCAATTAYPRCSKHKITGHEGAREVAHLQLEFGRAIGVGAALQDDCGTLIDHA